MSESKAGDAKQPKEMPPESITRLGGDRRRLIRGALAAAPVVAVLRSKNVLATVNCQAVSAYISTAAGTSLHPTPNTCTGVTPGYWGNHPENWPSPYSPGTQPANAGPHDWNNDGTKMNAVWTSATCSVNYNGVSMMRVIWGSDPFQAGAHLISAVLNLQSGRVSASILPLATIQAMGNAVLCGQLYQAAPGVFWDAAQVVTYLNQVQPV